MNAKPLVEEIFKGKNGFYGFHVMYIIDKVNTLSLNFYLDFQNNGNHYVMPKHRDTNKNYFKMSIEDIYNNIINSDNEFSIKSELLDNYWVSNNLNNLRFQLLNTIPEKIVRFTSFGTMIRMQEDSYYELQLGIVKFLCDEFKPYGINSQPSQLDTTMLLGRVIPPNEKHSLGRIFEEIPSINKGQIRKDFEKFSPDELILQEYQSSVLLRKLVRGCDTYYKTRISQA